MSVHCGPDKTCSKTPEFAFEQLDTADLIFRCPDGHAVRVERYKLLDWCGVPSLWMLGEDIK